MVINTWCKKVHPTKGDGGDGHVAEQEEGVGDAQGGEQQVEHIVHLPQSHQYTILVPMSIDVLEILKS